MSFRVTGIIAGFIGLMTAGLVTNVVLHRRSCKVGVGMGNDKALEMKIRAHGNLVETAPIAIILLGINEYHNYASEAVIGGLGAALLLGRILHAYAFTGSLSREDHMKYRVPGMALTLTSIITSSSLLIWHGFKSIFEQK